MGERLRPTRESSTKVETSSKVELFALYTGELYQIRAFLRSTRESSCAPRQKSSTKVESSPRVEPFRALHGRALAPYTGKLYQSRKLTQSRELYKKERW